MKLFNPNCSLPNDVARKMALILTLLSLVSADLGRNKNQENNTGTYFFIGILTGIFVVLFIRLCGSLGRDEAVQRLINTVPSYGSDQ